jgi:hypothetical protein
MGVSLAVWVLIGLTFRESYLRDDRGHVKMRRENILSCYAVGRGQDGWEAICVDFDIAVQGDSFADVTKKLREALVSFSEYVNALPVEERERFLNRRAPWCVRARMAFEVILTLLFRNRNDGRRQSFGLACPV